MNHSYPPPFPGQQYNYAPQDNFTPQFLANDLFAGGPDGKSRGVAALLCFFLGSLGIHYFYVGKTTGGIIYILLTILTCGAVTSIMALVQTILLLFMNNVDFYRRYVTSTATMPF